MLSRRVQHRLVVAAVLAGCERAFPSPVDTPDAAANSAPTIISVRADLVELPQYSVVVFEPSASTLDLTLYDTDVADTLYVRIFVNYNIPNATPPRSTARATVSGSVVRAVTVSMNGVCTTTEIGADPLPVLQIYIFDREVLDIGEPLYQRVVPGGLYATQTFFLRCEAVM
jgi:hypothetical protein